MILFLIFVVVAEVAANLYVKPPAPSWCTTALVVGFSFSSSAPGKGLNVSKPEVFQRVPGVIDFANSNAAGGTTREFADVGPWPLSDDDSFTVTARAWVRKINTNAGDRIVCAALREDQLVIGVNEYWQASASQMSFSLATSGTNGFTRTRARFGSEAEQVANTFPKYSAEWIPFTLVWDASTRAFTEYLHGGVYADTSTIALDRPLNATFEGSSLKFGVQGPLYRRFIDAQLDDIMFFQRAFTPEEVFSWANGACVSSDEFPPSVPCEGRVREHKNPVLSELLISGEGDADFSLFIDFFVTNGQTGPVVFLETETGSIDMIVSSLGVDMGLNFTITPTLLDSLPPTHETAVTTRPGQVNANALNSLVLVYYSSLRYLSLYVNGLRTHTVRLQTSAGMTFSQARVQPGTRYFAVWNRALSDDQIALILSNPLICEPTAAPTSETTAAPTDQPQPSPFVTTWTTTEMDVVPDIVPSPSSSSMVLPLAITGGLIFFLFLLHVFILVLMKRRRRTGGNSLTSPDGTFAISAPHQQSRSRSTSRSSGRKSGARSRRRSVVPGSQSALSLPAYGSTTTALASWPGQSTGPATPAEDTYTSFKAPTVSGYMAGSTYQPAKQLPGPGVAIPPPYAAVPTTPSSTASYLGRDHRPAATVSYDQFEAPDSGYGQLSNNNNYTPVTSHWQQRYN